jgi:hypothetical protein
MRAMSALALLCIALGAGCAAEPVVPAKPKGPLGLSTDNPMRVERMSEEVDFMASHKCADGGHWRMGDQTVLPTPNTPEATGCMFDKFAVTCSTTGELSAFYFLQCL